MVERHALHTIINETTTSEEYNAVIELAIEWNVCRAETPLEKNQRSICFRNANHSGKCGGLLYHTPSLELPLE